MNPRVFLRLLLALAATLLVAPLAARAEIPPDWTSADINTTNGSADVSAEGVWQVVGRGRDIWEQNDEFQYVSHRLQGDGSITVRILSQTTNSHAWAKAGVMLRESDAPNSPHIFLTMTPEFGVDQIWRTEANAYAAQAGGNQYPRRLPLYLRAQRQGDRFSTFVSEDGANWIAIGSTQRLKMGREILAGIAVTSVNKNVSSTARFDRVSVSDDLVPTGPATLQALVRDGASLVVWESVPRATGYQVYRRGPGETGYTRITRHPVAILSYEDPGLVNGSVYRYRITAVVDGRESAPSDIATVTPMAAIQEIFHGYTIGTTFAGSALVEADGTLTVRGSGWDIWGKQDGFYYLAAPAEGDFTISTRILQTPSQTSDWAKAGLMIRESLTWDARNVFFDFTAKNGSHVQWRKLTGGDSELYGGPPSRPPMYLRLVRRGDRITPQWSSDGMVWEPAGEPIRLDLLSRELWVGLAVTATYDRRVSSCRFRELSITPQ